MPDRQAEEYPLLLEDGDIAALLAQDAANLRAKYNRHGISAYLTPAKVERPSSTRVNTRFLQNTVRDVRGHNAMLAKRERDERLNMKNHPLKDMIGQPKSTPGPSETAANLSLRKQRRPSESGRDIANVDLGGERVLRRDGSRSSAPLEQRGSGHFRCRRSASPKARMQTALGHLLKNSPTCSKRSPKDHTSSSLEQHRQSRSSGDAQRQAASHHPGQSGQTSTAKDDSAHWRCGGGYL
ncbi:hypothetical protein BCR37DRAFT_253790 [Protomyces lactucae-debilis]|uniref:Uncharacterized protein n=1 Tax=Protomyces lactucae-debilis TaxID=2754530 RepID=A0A1Y2FLK7_PROLT|nr:uncharacterized protein BCR37DRAFT_253790 [Protomyces lactucae-debilis]ORY84872.1 hypothetical protein BCR37DRAFT_253790 [Protomyces lactucae-debilis]